MADSLRDKFQRLYETNRRRARIYGVLGRLAPNGEAQVQVPGRPERVFIRLDNARGSTWAYHHNAVNLDLVGLPIVLYQENGDLHIESENAAQLSAFLRGDVYTPHSHLYDDRYSLLGHVHPPASVSAASDVTYNRGPLQDVRDRGTFLVWGVAGLQGPNGWYPVHSLRFRVEAEIDHDDPIPLVADGEIAEALIVSAVIRSTAGVTWYPWNMIPVDDADDLFDDGPDTLTLSVTATGGAELQRTAGTATYNSCKIFAWWE